MTTEWINKYQPKKISDLITNTTAVRTLSTWLGNYEKRKRDNLKADKKQKKKDKNDPNSKFTSCVIATGDHGVGKTTAVNIVLKEYNYEVHNINLNILKNIKSVDDIINKIMLTSNVLSIMNNDSISKNAIVIDELESISSSVEKGHILSLQKLNDANWYCPIIFISNNQHNKLITSIKKTSMEIKFFLPFPSDMKKILVKISKSENLRIDHEVIINKLIKHSQGDIRRLIYTLHDIKNTYDNKQIDLAVLEDYFSRSTSKNVNMELFTATSILFYEYTNINNCLRLYEDEKTLLPLMIHHNYINNVITNIHDPLRQFDLTNKISQLLSDGDVIENYIYGDQNWGMQDIHGLYTTSLPSYYLCEEVNKNKNIEKIRLGFSTDLNKTSIKKINKKNILKTDDCLKNMDIEDYIYINKIIKKLIDEGNIKDCAELLNIYNIKLEQIESLIKIDKIKDSQKDIKTVLTAKQKNEFLQYLNEDK